MRGTSGQLLDLADESIVSSRAGQIVSWNLAATALYGWRPEEAIGRPIDDLVGEYAAEVRDAVLNDKTWKGTATRRRRDGSQVEVVLRVAREDSGASDAEWLEVSRAHDAAHPAEKALKESEYRYRNLFGAVAASFWELDFTGVGAIIRDLLAEGVVDLEHHLLTHTETARAMMRATRIIDVNDRSTEMFGPASKRTLMATPLDQYWPEGSTDIYARSVVAAVGGKPHFIAETRMRRLDGREFDALFTVTFLPGTVGQGTLLVGFTDISERIQTARQLGEASMRQKMYLDVPTIALSEITAPELTEVFSRIRAEGHDSLGPYIDRNPDFVGFAIGALRFENVNEAAVKMLCAVSRAALIGRTLTGIIPPDSEEFRRSLEGSFLREPVFQAELRMHRLDGTPVDTLFCRVSNSGEDRAKVLVAQIDITDQVTARREIERMRRKMTHASRISILGQLSASIVHEISQPITALMNHAAAAQRHVQRLEGAGRLENTMARIGLQAERARSIILRIRSMAADRESSFLPVALSQIVEETRLLLRQEIVDSRVRIKIIDPSPLPSVLGDRIQLQQVLTNLMLNAMQAMDETPPESRRLSVCLSHEEGFVRVDVADRGTGLSPVILAEPFESFRTTKPDGLGIGLGICRSIVEAHGGALELANRNDGCGARATFRIPVLPETGI